MEKILATFALAFLMAACSSTPSAPPEPEWVKGPARTVDNGYIVYVGMGEGRTAESARFKAESAALQDLVNECSLAPKGAKTEDHFDETVGDRAELHRAYAKIAVEFLDCEEAKAAVTPDQVRKLANVPMTEELKRYQDMIGKPELEEQGETLAAAGNASSNGTGGNSNASQGSGVAPPPSNENQFFVMRQSVVYMKEDVILSPPTAYAAASPQAQQFTQTVTPATTQIHNYEATHPELQHSSRTWSQVSREMHYGKNRGNARQWKANRGGQHPASAPQGRRGRRRRRQQF